MDWSGRRSLSTANSPAIRRITSLGPAATLGLLAAVVAGLPACSRHSAEAPPPPVHYAGLAYELANATELPDVPAQELPGLHNVYRLSERIVSGGEPASDEAFAQLANMGIATILSVDGKVPDAETAARYGMTYVHLPIQYKGITDDELLDISKTFREQQGPFYVHCFHGRHRGPAAAAVGRLILDGVPRETALAEMRQWSGTSPQYEGLYATIAKADLPSVAATETHAFDFPAAHPFEGVRATMISVPRAHDALMAMAELGWTLDPAHPDVDPVRETEILAGLFGQLVAQEQTLGMPEDFRAWAEAARRSSTALFDAMREARTGLAAHEAVDGDTGTRIDAILADVTSACSSCHAIYRN